MGDFFISVSEIRSLLAAGALPRILDVRKRGAFAESGNMIPGAEWRDPSRMHDWITDLGKGELLVVHCVHGHEVSQNAVRALRDAGFDARVLEGGFEGWREAGGAIVPVSSMNQGAP